MQASAVPTPPVPPTPPSVQVQAGAARAGQETLRILQAQLQGLQQRREEIAGQLRNPMVDGADEAGLERQLEGLDARILGLEEQIANVEADVAGVPRTVATTAPPPVFEGRQGPPDEVFAIPIVFTIFVLFPIALAFARRIWKRTPAGAPVAGAVPPAWMQERFARLEQSVDAIAVEVERVSEGQRFLTKVFAEPGNRQALGQGPAQPVELAAREPAAARRGE